MTTGTDIAALQARLDAAQKEHLRAEGAREAAKASLERAEGDLHTQFGVHGLDAAKDMLRELNEELAAAVTNLNALLDKLEGQQ